MWAAESARLPESASGAPIVTGFWAAAGRSPPATTSAATRATASIARVLTALHQDPSVRTLRLSMCICPPVGRCGLFLASRPLSNPRLVRGLPGIRSPPLEDRLPRPAPRHMRGGLDAEQPAHVPGGARRLRRVDPCLHPHLVQQVHDVLRREVAHGAHAR